MIREATPARAPLPEAQSGISNHGWERRTEPKTISMRWRRKVGGWPSPRPSGETYLLDDCNANGDSPWLLLQETGQCSLDAMRKFIAALALISLIAIPTLTPDCKRSPRVTGELLVRKQRLLTTPEQTSVSARGSTRRTAG
jgi:hypothetical protein